MTSFHLADLPDRAVFETWDYVPMFPDDPADGSKCYRSPDGKWQIIDGWQSVQYRHRDRPLEVY